MEYIREDLSAKEYVKYFRFFINLNMTGTMGKFIEYKDENGQFMLRVLWKDDHALVWTLSNIKVLFTGAGAIACARDMATMKQVRCKK